MEENVQEKDLKKQVKEKVDEIIGQIINEGIDKNNLENLGQLIDIHKDIANEEYWEKKKEVMEMNYRGYGEYEEGYGEGNYSRRGVRGSGRGRRRYSARGGRGGSYQGEEMMEEMKFHYGNYSEGKEEYGAGNYGAKKETMKALDEMMQSVVDFIEMLKEEAQSQEEIELIKHYSKKIAEM